MIDIQNDSNFAFLNMAYGGEMPIELEKVAMEASQGYDLDRYVDGAFADQVNRKFPIFTPEMAVLSAAYMQHQDIDPLVKEACERALQDWGIEGISLDKQEREEQYLELPKEAFLLKEAQKFPVIDRDTLEKSAYAVKSSLGQMDIPQRVEACTNLYKKAVYEYDVDPTELGEDIVSYAQEAPCSLVKLAMSINERYAETGEQGYQDYLEKLSAYATQHKDESYIFDKSLMSGMAVELYYLDKEAGIQGEFDAIRDVFNSPFYVNENGELEKAATVSSVVIGDYYIPEQALEKVAREEFAEAFPGLDEEVYVGDDLDPDKLVQVVDEVLIIPESKNQVGEFLNQYVN